MLSSSAPNLLRGTVYGSAEPISDANLHHSGLQVPGAEGTVEEARLFGQFAEAQSHGRTLTGSPSILTSVRRGQIHFLVLSERKRTSDKDELLSLPAIETLCHGGHVAPLLIKTCRHGLL